MALASSVLATPGHALEQHVAAERERGQHDLERLALPDDDLADLARDALAELLHRRLPPVDRAAQRPPGGQRSVAGPRGARHERRRLRLAEPEARRRGAQLVVAGARPEAGAAREPRRAPPSRSGRPTSAGRPVRASAPASAST